MLNNLGSPINVCLSESRFCIINSGCCDAKRHVIVTEAAEFYGVSPSTIYRQLRKYNKLSIDHRADYNKSRIINLNKMRYYCEIIAALKYRTTKKKTSQIAYGNGSIIGENGI